MTPFPHICPKNGEKHIPMREVVSVWRTAQLIRFNERVSWIEWVSHLRWNRAASLN